MSNQPKQKTYRPLVGPAEIPSGVRSFEAHEAPAPEISITLLERGRERYNIYCAPCHGANGDGKGMIVQRGFPAPPSYHIQRLRDAPPQHFFDVITQGFGAMYSYAERVRPVDRWAIAAYIRALQRSQSAMQSPEHPP
ncbi:cytochrome c [Methylocystis sp. MJC1]|jgi:mono/diheme cytochrome c family protein